MNKFDLLKSHIEAYTRKDGVVVQAHDTKIQTVFGNDYDTKAVNAIYPRGGKSDVDERISAHSALAEHHDKARKYHIEQASVTSGQNQEGHYRAADLHLNARNGHHLAQSYLKKPDPRYELDVPESIGRTNTANKFSGYTGAPIKKYQSV